jgi:guanine nucleotide-binding protein subunit alpha
MMAEDVHTNRMQDALTVFDFIVNHPLLKQPSIIVLFNKMDKFKSKAKTVDIKKYFPDYDGKKLKIIIGREKSVSNGFKYFQTRFKNVIKGERIVDFHPTCATDTDTMRVLIQSMM